MSNVTNVFNPRDVDFRIGPYQITGFSAAENAIEYASPELNSDLVQGLNATTIVYGANISINITIRLLSSHVDNTYLFGFMSANYFSNNGLFGQISSAAASTVASALPLTIYVNNPNGPSFAIATQSFTITNVIDANMPFVATTRMEREWRFKATFEIQDIYGQIATG